ncbi:MAG: peroxiredoxin-like family protein, partial [Myxococcota bacterium]
MTTHTPSIGEQTQAFLAGPAAALPVAVMDAFAAEHADLDEAGVPAGVSAPGALMPDGELLDVDGATTSLAQV